MRSHNSFLALLVPPRGGGALWVRGKRAGDHYVRGVMHHPVVMGYLMGFYLRLQGLDKGVQGGHGIACLVVGVRALLVGPYDVADLTGAWSHMAFWLRLCSSRIPSELQRTGEQTRSPLLWRLYGEEMYLHGS